MSRGRLCITLAALQCMDSKELNSFLFVQHPKLVTEGKMTLKYRSKGEFLGKKRLRLIRLSLLNEPSLEPAILEQFIYHLSSTRRLLKLLLILKYLMTGPEGNSQFCFPRISMFPETRSRETLRFEGNKIHCSQAKGPVIK